jgi:cytochrome d ubiquinol oxidase subunit I
VWIGSFLAGAFLVMSVHAWYLLKSRHVELSKKAFTMALVVATVFSLSQLVSGHSTADGVAVNQPAKLAAMEGHYAASAPGDLYLFGWVDQHGKQVYGPHIPGGTSLLLHGDPRAPITGLDAFHPNDRPKHVNAVFQVYHLMVGIGMTLIALTLFGTWMMWRKRLFEQKWLLRVFVLAVFLPQIANQAGWFTAEMGRQPWVVYGLLRTSDALSASVKAEQVLFSLILFTLIYALLLVLFLYLLNKKIVHGPDEHTPTTDSPKRAEMIGAHTAGA